MFEVIISFLIAGAIVYLAYQVLKSNLEPEGKTDLNAVESLDRAVDQVIEKVDVNQDGKVNVKDAEAVLEKVKEKVKKNVAQSEEAKVVVETVVEAAPVATDTAPPKRARNKGKFKADDKATTETNEAWEGGKAPAKKEKDPAKKKPRKPKMTVVK